MTTSLIDLSRLVNHANVFADAAKACGFSSHAEISRFIFKTYGKALKGIPPASRPKGAIFFLTPALSPGGLASPANLKSVIADIRTHVSKKFFSLPLDLGGQGAVVAHETTGEEQQTMVGGGWTAGQAAQISHSNQLCVVWANGVSAHVFLNGNSCIETPDVVEEISIGIPSGFQSLSWDDGQILFEFAKHKLNDTSPAGIWRLPKRNVLRPKPERLMSVALGEFLRNRMAAYKHHDDEPYVENQGRADISLHSYNGFVYIIEVKWMGRSIKLAKDSSDDKEIETQAKKPSSNWFTVYGKDVFESGAKQLSSYFSTGKYQRAYLAVFDCSAANGGVSEKLAVDGAHVAPYPPCDFASLRACVEPLKASVKSKMKN